jgi:alpha-amylase
VPRKRARSEVDPETASKILAAVPPPEAFLFFTDIGGYTGELAACLSDFCDKLKIIPAESIQFHHERGDFGKWIRETLGDEYLAERISRIKSTQTEELRKKIERIVKRRLDQLKRLA